MGEKRSNFFDSVVRFLYCDILVRKHAEISNSRSKEDVRLRGSIIRVVEKECGGLFLLRVLRNERDKKLISGFLRRRFV